MTAPVPFPTLAIAENMAEYPDDADGDALRRVAEHGSNMDEPTKIEFSIDVRSKNAGIAIAEQAATPGYEPDLFFDDETDRWSAYCGKRMIASYDNVDKGQRELNEIAVEHCSKCDGWVTGGN